MKFNQAYFRSYEYYIAKMAREWMVEANQYRKEAAEAKYYGYDIATRMAKWAEAKAKRQYALYKKCRAASTESEKNDLYQEALNIEVEPFINRCYDYN